MKRFKMKYKIEKNALYDNNLSILGGNFVKNNRNKGRLIIENKKYYLKEFINSDNFKNSYLKINILLNKDNCNMRIFLKILNYYLNFQ